MYKTLRASHCAMRSLFFMGFGGTKLKGCRAAHTLATPLV